MAEYERVMLLLIWLNENVIIVQNVMKILIVSQYYYPEQFQINDIAPELVKRGHEVTVLCGVPNYPKGVVFKSYETREERELAEEKFRSLGADIRRVVR